MKENKTNDSMTAESGEWKKKTQEDDHDETAVEQFQNINPELELRDADYLLNMIHLLNPNYAHNLSFIISLKVEYGNR